MTRLYLLATFSNGFVLSRQTTKEYSHAWFCDFESSMFVNKDGSPHEVRMSGFSSTYARAHRATMVRNLKVVRREVVPVVRISRAKFEAIRNGTA